RGGRWRAREALPPPLEVGPPPWNWLNERPGIERRLPAALRSRISIRSLRPAAAGWVKSRFAGVRIRAGGEITGAVAKGDQIAVHIGSELHIYDHVLLATGYKANIAKYRILSDALMQKVVCTDGS